MDLWMLFAPLYAVALAGVCAVALAYGRRRAWPMVGLVCAASVLLVSRMGPRLSPWLGSPALGWGLGAVLLCVAGVVAYRAERPRGRAELLLSSAPTALDEAIDALRGSGHAPASWVLKGWLGTDSPVTSPGGVVCAFYEAELRGIGERGRKGPLLWLDRAFPEPLWLRGERSRATLSSGEVEPIAPERVRHCRLGRGFRIAGHGELAGELPPIEALSYERLGKLGERCLVAGVLRPGAREGSYVISGPRGAPPIVVVGQEPLEVARRLLRRAWGLYGGAVGLVIAAAFLLARASVF
jgi:hypothetical protein